MAMGRWSTGMPEEVETMGPDRFAPMLVVVR